MNDRDKDFDEFLDMGSKSKGNAMVKRQTIPQNRTTAHHGWCLSFKRMSAKRRKARQHKIAIASAMALVLLFLMIVLICKSYACSNDALAELSGIWHYDQYTEYGFDGKGNGCMCLDNSNRFEFTYKAEDCILYLDFALDYVTDCQYTYTVDGDDLTLVGGEGTIGGIYTLTRVDESFTLTKD